MNHKDDGVIVLRQKSGEILISNCKEWPIDMGAEAEGEVLLKNIVGVMRGTDQKILSWRRTS
ncbi:MAG: hypothetical protein ACE5NG_00590 [bacterium]